MKFPHHRWIWPPQVKLCRGYRNLYKEVYETVLKAVPSRLQSNRTDRQKEQWTDIDKICSEKKEIKEYNHS